MSYTVTSPALKKLEKQLRKYPAISKKYFSKAIVAATVEIHKRAIRGIVPWKTGTLARTFAFTAVASQLMGKVYPTRDYAGYVHEGTKPHVIYPVNKRALFWAGANHPVKRVNHPGQKPQPFLPKMIEAALSDVNKHFENAGDSINREIASKLR